MLYSIIVPCYKSSHTIRDVVRLTSEKMREMGKTPFEFVLVDDCSPDDGETICTLRELADEYDFVNVVELAQNAGQHNAVMAGLNYAEGDVLIAMDDDLQTHPSQLPKLFEAFDQGYDIVYGYYPQKHHGVFRNFGSWVNYMSVRILIGKPKELKTSSFWIIRRFVRDYVVQYTSHYTHLQGLFLRTTRNIACVPVEHFDRGYGQSGYTLKKLISLWSNIMGYSIVPLRIATRVGTLFAVLSIFGAIAVVLKKIFAPTSAVGWYSLIVSIFFLSGLIMIFLGLIGEYLGRMFQNLSNNPQFVVRHFYKGRIHEGKRFADPEDDSEGRRFAEPAPARGGRRYAEAAAEPEGRRFADSTPKAAPGTGDNRYAETAPKAASSTSGRRYAEPTYESVAEGKRFAESAAPEGKRFAEKKVAAKKNDEFEGLDFDYDRRGGRFTYIGLDYNEDED